MVRAVGGVILSLDYPFKFQKFHLFVWKISERERGSSAKQQLRM